MGNARLFFDIRKRIKKIRWESRKKLPGDMPQAALAMYILDFFKHPRLDQMDSVKETLADRSLNAKLFSEADNRSGEHIDFRAFSDLKILKR